MTRTICSYFQSLLMIALTLGSGISVFCSLIHWLSGPNSRKKGSTGKAERQCNSKQNNSVFVTQSAIYLSDGPSTFRDIFYVVDWWVLNLVTKARWPNGFLMSMSLLNFLSSLGVGMCLRLCTNYSHYFCVLIEAVTQCSNQICQHPNNALKSCMKNKNQLKSLNLFSPQRFMSYLG